MTTETRMDIIRSLSATLLALWDVKHCIDPVYVMVDFICKGYMYLELLGTRVERDFQNEKFFPIVRFEAGTFR